MFRFSIVGIEAGAILTFARNEGYQAKVVDDRNVEFEGKVMTLSLSAAEILQRDHGWGNSGVQGPAYWMYEGETLHERRVRLEEEDK